MKQIIFCVHNFAGLENDRHEININEIGENTKHLAIREQNKTTTLKALIYARWLLMDSFMGEPGTSLFVPTYLNRGGVTSFSFLLTKGDAGEKYGWKIKLFNGVIIFESYYRTEGRDTHIIFNRHHPQYDEIDKNFYGSEGPAFNDFDANAKHVFESPNKELMGITRTVRTNASLYSTWRQFGYEEELDIHLTYANLSHLVGDSEIPLGSSQDTLKALYEDKKLQDSLCELLTDTYCLSEDTIMENMTGITINKEENFTADGRQSNTYIGYVNITDHKGESSIMFSWLPKKALLLTHYFVQISKNIKDMGHSLIVLDDIDQAGVDVSKLGSIWQADAFTKFIYGIKNGALVCSTSDVQMPYFDDDEDY